MTTKLTAIPLLNINPAESTITSEKTKQHERPNKHLHNSHILRFGAKNCQDWFNGKPLARSDVPGHNPASLKATRPLQAPGNSCSHSQLGTGHVLAMLYCFQKITFPVLSF